MDLSREQVLDLAKSENFADRLAAVQNSYGGEELDILLNDSDWRIRLEVAKIGYKVDQLANDPDEHVRAEVEKWT